MVRDFSTGGGHGPEDVLVEGDENIVTKKWQGYPPQNLNLVGKPHPPMPEVAIPRFTGTAQYATRVQFSNLLYAKLLTSPHPRARVTRLDATAAERMPGVAHVLTYQNAPENFRMLAQDLGFQGAVVAVVAADTEDLAEDAVAAIAVEYEELPALSTLQQLLAPNAPDHSGEEGYIESVVGDGDVEQGFRDADVVKEFTYYYAGATVVPMQPLSGVAKWDGDKLTLWGMGQSVHPGQRVSCQNPRHRLGQRSLHQQVERWHVRVSEQRRGQVFATYRAYREVDRAPHQDRAPEGPGVGPPRLQE